MNKKLIAMLFIGLFLLSIVPAFVEAAADTTPTGDEFSGLEPGEITKLEQAELLKQLTARVKKLLPFIDVMRKTIRGFTGFFVKIIVKRFDLSLEYAHLITDVATMTFFAFILGKILAYVFGGAVLSIIAKNKQIGAATGAILGGIAGYYFKDVIGGFLKITGEAEVFYTAIGVGAAIGIGVGLILVAVKNFINAAINVLFISLISLYYLFGYFKIYPFAMSQFKEPILWAGLISGLFMGVILYFVIVEGLFFGSLGMAYRFVFKKAGPAKTREKMLGGIWRFFTRQKKREKAAVGEGEAETQIEAARKILEELEGSISNTYANLLHEAGMRGWREDEAMKRHCSDLERKMKARMAQEMNANFRMIRSVTESINILVEAEEPFTEEKKK